MHAPFQMLNVFFISGILGIFTITAIGCAGHNAGLSVYDWNSLPFHTALAAFGGHLAWQVLSADLNDPANLATRFRSNAYVAPIIVVGIACAKLQVPIT